MDAANARRVVVTDYGPDPVSPARQLLDDVFLRLHGFIAGGVYAGGDLDPGQQLGGYAQPQQDFAGMASPAVTTVAYRNGDYPELSTAVSAGAMGDPTRRIFADRLRRRR